MLGWCEGEIAPTQPRAALPWDFLIIPAGPLGAQESLRRGTQVEDPQAVEGQVGSLSLEVAL